MFWNVNWIPSLIFSVFYVPPSHNTCIHQSVTSNTDWDEQSTINFKINHMKTKFMFQNEPQGLYSGGKWWNWRGEKIHLLRADGEYVLRQMLKSWGE